MAVAAAIIVLAALLAYSRAFSGPFVFDDLAAIKDGNPTIRHLWPLGPVLSPPPENGQTVGGRPVLNFSLALNYALSGTEVWSYHLVNLLIHILAGLTLFGIVRRTVEMQPEASDGKTGDSATILGGAVALLWTLHPVQTESVTYVIQRAESLMGLFYLQTLYCFIRSFRLRPPLVNSDQGKRAHGGGSPGTLGRQTKSPARQAEIEGTEVRGRSIPWLILSVVFCILGMATKETMVSAPVVVLLYDRILASGSFRNVWARSRAYYLSLASTWILLAWLVAGTHGRGGTAGWQAGLSGWNYLLTELPALVHYLRLAVWPVGLTFDYGGWTAPSLWAVATCGAVLFALALAAALALWRGHPAGFLGACFFALLAPSSSFVPIEVQPVAEHRMYLPLAVVMVALVMLARNRAKSVPISLILPAALLGCMTF